MSQLPTVDLNSIISIEEFKNNSTVYDNLGIPLINRFACQLQAPQQYKSEKAGWLDFQVLSVDCPGISITTVDSELNGVNRFYFKNRSYDGLMITFLESSELTMRNFFFQWMQSALKIDPSTGGVVRNYLNDVVAPEFRLIPLDFSGKGRRVDIFRDVFPTKIQDINYNYASYNEIVRCTVTFNYRFHSVETLSGDDPTLLPKASNVTSEPESSTKSSIIPSGVVATASAVTSPTIPSVSSFTGGGGTFGGGGSSGGF